MRVFVGIESNSAFAQSFGDDFFQMDKGSSDDEQDILGIDADILLIGVLAAAFGRNVGDCSFDDFEEGLLDPFAGDIAGDGDIAGRLADLIDFIDIDNAHFRAGDIVVCRLDKAQDDVFDVFSDIAGFGEGRGIGDGKGDIEDSGKGAGHQCFSGSGGAEQEDIGFAVFDFALFMQGADPLIVVVNSNGNRLFCFFLADDILVQSVL